LEKSQWDIVNRIHVLYSALQKAIRWCETNDARYFAQALIEMEIPAPINRLLIIAAEDVGLADPTLLRYVGECLDTFETMVKEYEAPKNNVSAFPEIRAVVDRAVIAAALSYKSRLLAMLSFATSFEIYKKEDFSHHLSEYKTRFHTAIQRQDEKEAAYYGYVLGFCPDAEDALFEVAKQESKTRNTELIHEWSQEYKKPRGNKRKEEKRLLTLAGIISLLCRDLNYLDGEYVNKVSDWLSRPIEQATIPDRAYDMHTLIGKKKGRGLEHFFDEAASIENKRFTDDWEEAGKQAHFQAQKEGLEESDVINAIKEKVKKAGKGKRPASEFVIDLFKVQQ
jgi:hypothetical protein